MRFSESWLLAEFRSDEEAYERSEKWFEMLAQLYNHLVLFISANGEPLERHVLRVYVS